MANERNGEASKGPRDLELADHIREVERAAADWGVHVDALEGRFIGALLAAIRESGRTNLAVLGDIEALLERARSTGEGELRRIGLLIEASQRTLSMAQEAAETSAASGERAERVFNASVAKIAKDLSVKLLDECQQWLVLKQTQRNRRDARRLAVGVAAAAIAVFVGGYAMAGGDRTRRRRRNRPWLRRSSGAGRSRLRCMTATAARSKCAAFRISWQSKAADSKAADRTRGRHANGRGRLGSGDQTLPTPGNSLASIYIPTGRMIYGSMSWTPL